VDAANSLQMQPIDLGSGKAATRPSDLVYIIVQATEKQVAEMAIADPEGRDEFTISSDALNFWRVAWRCAAEWATPALDENIAREVKEGICSVRGYDPDDFDSALHATKGRARLPFGWSALDLAWQMASRDPLSLLDPNVANRRVPTAIAAIAYHLQSLQGEESILLPIDQLRALLEQRKIVVSGAVQRLVEAGLLEFVDKSYHTGKAREFRFTGVEGKHFEKIINSTSDRSS
jgi:hypothetical protein